MVAYRRDEVAFDAGFLARLKERDPATCAWFFFHFTPILEAKFRYQFEDYSSIEDVRNETFCRVIELVDRERIREPERFGSFVCGVGSKVAQECRRKMRRTESLPADSGEPLDQRPLIDRLLADGELMKIVRAELTKLPAEERKLISESYLEGRERRKMARERDVSPGGLNVRLFRALNHLRKEVRRNLGNEQMK